MEAMATAGVLLAAAACAATMGYAIQRGATCTVAAVDELLRQRQATRLRALCEASLWVAGGLLLARELHLLTRMPAGHALTGWTVFGAALLGLGAWLNRACVFGAVARFGSGEWAYAATPVGYYLGCLSVGLLFAPPPTRPLADGSPVLAASSLAAWPVAAVLAGRVLWPCLRPRRGPPSRPLAARLWAPHTATCIIGLTFLAMLLLVGAWAYTDVLAELAHGMAQNLAARTLLLGCLLGGAALGGWTAGRFRATRIGAPALLRCLAGGALMGWGGALIPGGNDGLILVGMPLLWPYAWVAFATMCATIAAAQGMTRTLAADRGRRREGGREGHR